MSDPDQRYAVPPPRQSPGGPYQQQMTGRPGQPPVGGAGFARPHRGVLILVLGILGFVVCFICGIAAWVMGNTDLREMRAGRMDRSGEGLTQAGRVCGMVATILVVAGLALWLLAVIFIGLVRTV